MCELVERARVDPRDITQWLPRGSADATVKAASPERGRSEAESLDSAAASPKMKAVMSRTPRACSRVACETETF